MPTRPVNALHRSITVSQTCARRLYGRPQDRVKPALSAVSCHVLCAVNESAISEQVAHRNAKIRLLAPQCRMLIIQHDDMILPRRDDGLLRITSCWAEVLTNFSHTLALLRAQACVQWRMKLGHCLCYCNCLGSMDESASGKAQGYLLDVPM